MVAALCQGDYSTLGALADRYWTLRTLLDPEATNPAIDHLFTNPEISDLTTGGLITGAGGGGFALFISRPDQASALRTRLNKLRKDPSFAKSSVVAYQLNPQGIELEEQ